MSNEKIKVGGTPFFRHQSKYHELVAALENLHVGENGYSEWLSYTCETADEARKARTAMSDRNWYRHGWHLRTRLKENVAWFRFEPDK